MIIIERSSTERRRIAETIPVGIPIRSQITTAPSVRKIVAGSRSKISSRTGDVELVAVAEVEVQDQVLDVDPVLLVDRLVEAEALADLGDLRLVRLPPGAQLGRIGRRQRVEDHEDHRAGDEEQRDAPEEAARDVVEHGVRGAGCDLPPS